VAPQSFTVAAVAAVAPAAAAVASAVAAAAVVVPDGEVVVCAVFSFVARYQHTNWPPDGPPRCTSCPDTSSSTTRTTGAIGSGGGHRPIISLLDSIF